MAPDLGEAGVEASISAAPSPEVVPIPDELDEYTSVNLEPVFGSIEEGSALIDDAVDGTSKRWDAILLDVDNGPDGIVRDANNRIYSRTGLAKARDALKPGGILAVWSAGPDPAFRKRLYDTGLEVVEWNVRSRPNNKGAHHIIWFARKS